MSDTREADPDQEADDRKQQSDARPRGSDRDGQGDGDKKDGDEKGDEKKNDEKKDDEKKKPRSRLPLIIAVIVVLLAVAAGVTYWLLTQGQESTDDAYTEGNAVSIAPKISGYVVENRINDNTLVRAGDLLLKIDPRDYITARDQAQANLDLALAQLASAETDLVITRVKGAGAADPGAGAAGTVARAADAGRTRRRAPARGRSARHHADQCRPGQHDIARQ